MKRFALMLGLAALLLAVAAPADAGLLRRPRYTNFQATEENEAHPKSLMDLQVLLEDASGFNLTIAYNAVYGDQARNKGKITKKSYVRVEYPDGTVKKIKLKGKVRDWTWFKQLDFEDPAPAGTIVEWMLVFKAMPRMPNYSEAGIQVEIQPTTE